MGRSGVSEEPPLWQGSSKQRQKRGRLLSTFGQPQTMETLSKQRVIYF